MNCSECKNNLSHLLEAGDDNLAAQLKNHLADCPDCYVEYEEMMDVIALLKPKDAIKAPALLKENILSEIQKEENKKAKVIRLNTWKKAVIGIAAALILIIIIPMFGNKDNPNAVRANIIFTKAINALESVTSMLMVLDVRTEPKENFDFINKDGELVQHTIAKIFTGKEKWSIDKGGRKAVMTGDSTFLYIPSWNYAIYIKAKASGMIGWFNTLLYPSNILRREQLQAAAKNSKIKIEEKGNDIYLSVTSKAEGNFINEVGKNSSISQSDNRREYVFDKKTNLLQSLKVYLLDSGKETLILDLKSVQYDVALNDSAFQIKLPEDVQWTAYLLPKGDNGLTAKQTAEIILKDLSKNDFETHKEMWGFFSKQMMKLAGDTYKGIEIISLGEPFQSGNFPGYYVPYEIKLKDGSIKKFQLALKNDNAAKSWYFSGGL